MKVKTSVTLSTELITAMDSLIEEGQNRSLFLEIAAWEYVARSRREKQNQRDLETINRNEAYLNAEAEDALSFQIDL